MSWVQKYSIESPTTTEKQMQTQMPKTTRTLKTEKKETEEKMTRNLERATDNESLYKTTWRERNSSLWDTFTHVFPTISHTEYGDSQIATVFPWRVTRSFPGLIDGVGIGDTPEDALRMAQEAFKVANEKDVDVDSKRRLEQMLMERKLNAELKKKHRAEKRKGVFKRTRTF